MRAVPIAVLLLVAGCGAPEDAANQAENIVLGPEALLPPSSPTSLAGVDFTRPVRAFGTEPYWSLDIAPDALRFEDYSTKDGEAIDWAPQAPRVAGNRAVIRSRTPAGEAVTVTLAGESCLEVGGEGNTLPLTAKVTIGTRTLTGCAGEKLGGMPPADNATDAR